jgi:hypothetical protein
LLILNGSRRNKSFEFFEIISIVREGRGKCPMQVWKFQAEEMSSGGSVRERYPFTDQMTNDLFVADEVEINRRYCKERTEVIS